MRRFPSRKSQIPILLKIRVDIKPEKVILKSKSYFDKYGSISLLFSWLPIIGDPITFVAGILKYDLKKFIVLVVIAKLSRYLFIAYLVV